MQVWFHSGLENYKNMLIDFRTLFPKYNIKPRGVLHIGANIGEEAPVYDELGIKKVIWIEGNPEIFLKLKSYIARYPEQVGFNFCIGDEDRDAVLHVSNNGSQSSSILELGTHKDVHPDVYYVKDVPVKLNRIDSLFEDDDFKDKVDFLNIDLQGAELMALNGMGDLLKWFNSAYLEVNKNHLYEGCVLVEELDQFMATKGFERVETKWAGNTGWGDALFVRKS